MKKYSALIISLSVFWIAIIIVFFSLIGHTGGMFFYTLDDPYIHMAMAKNFFLHGMWGITKHEFTSCSSSPLWTLLLSALYFIFGVKDIIPFVLNVIFASLTAFISFLLIKKFTKNVLIQIAVLLFVFFFSPFISVVFTGLEHSMYSFFFVLTFYYIYEILNGRENNANSASLLISFMLLTAARYEGMFAAFAATLVLVYSRKYLVGILIPVFSFLPVLVIGVISVSKGWYFFPNSVLLKSTIAVSDINTFINSLLNPQFFGILWAYKRILILLIISGSMLFMLKKDKDNAALKSLITVFIIITLLHINFAKLGSLLRYEMYIMTSGVLLNSLLLIKYLKDKSKILRLAVFAFVFAVSILYSISTYNAVADVPTASTNIYQMQYQMSRFINKYYAGSSIALNDIGAVNYYCDIYCTDMWGLASKEIAVLRRTDKYSTEEINRINRERKTEIAILFDSWFEKYGGVPKNWYNSGIWRIPNNITCGSDVISFYASDSIAFHNLDKNLLEFNSELPDKVVRSGEFMKRHTGF